MWLVGLKLQVILTSVLSVSAKCQMYIPFIYFLQVCKTVHWLLGSYIVFGCFIDKGEKLYGVWVKHLSPYVSQKSGSCLILFILTDIT